jgi:hypothetical protein
MTLGPRPLLVQTLDPAVTSFRSADPEYRLRDDLERLDGVCGQAPEAVVLYAHRVLRGLVRVLLHRVHAPGRDDRANLELLWRYFNLPLALKRWLERLCDLGSDAARPDRPLAAPDAEVALLILFRWLHWFFCEQAWGPFLNRLTVHNQPLDGLLPGELTALVQRLSTADVTDEAFLASLHLDDPDSLALLTPVLPAVLAEQLLARDRPEQAETVIARARERFGRDLRLRQLEALCASRRSDRAGGDALLHRARHLLEGIEPTGSPADQETLGILAGVYKRLWQQAPAQRDWLRRCHDTYRAGWVQSQQANAYLGVNAASTALWLGQDLARQLAEQVCQTLDERLHWLNRSAEGGPGPMTYWDQVTLAEARLLLGDEQGAGELYRAAFARFESQTADVAVACAQARRILEHRGQAERAAAILGRWGAAGAPPRPITEPTS